MHAKILRRAQELTFREHLSAGASLVAGVVDERAHRRATLLRHVVQSYESVRLESFICAPFVSRRGYGLTRSHAFNGRFQRCAVFFIANTRMPAQAASNSTAGAGEAKAGLL